MHARARQRIGELMYSEDERVALAAAEIVIERVEGKVTQPIRDDGPPPITMDDVTMRFVTSLHMLRGYSIAQALDYAERNQEEVQEWGRAHGLLPRPGGLIQ